MCQPSRKLSHQSESDSSATSCPGPLEPVFSPIVGNMVVKINEEISLKASLLSPCLLMSLVCFPLDRGQEREHDVGASIAIQRPTRDGPLALVRVSDSKKLVVRLVCCIFKTKYKPLPLGVSRLYSEITILGVPSLSSGNPTCVRGHGPLNSHPQTLWSGECCQLRD